MKKIISISLKDNFLKSVTENIIYKENCTDYSRICLVLSGKRPSLYLRKYLAMKIKSSFYPPVIFTINDFMKYITEKRFADIKYINELDGIWKLYNLLINKNFFHNKDETEDDFFKVYPWVRKIYGFINQIDTEDVSDNVLMNIQYNAELGYNVPDNINKLFLNIVDFRKELHEMFKKDQTYTRGYNYLKAKDICKDEKFEEFDRIYFAGLFALTGTEKAVIKTLLKEDIARLIWHGDPEDWGILNNLKVYFNEEIDMLNGSRSIKKKDVKIYSSFDYHSESEQVYRVLKNKKEIKSTAIVAPVNDTLFPLLSFVIDRLLFDKKIDKFNISLDYPVIKTALFTFLKSCINCQITSQYNKNLSKYYVETYLHLFDNPFIKNININEITIRDIIKKIKANFIDSESNLYNKAFISLNEVEDIFFDTQKDIINKLHKLLFIDLEKKLNLQDACECIENILDFILNNSEVRSYILSGEIFNLFFDNLNELKQSDFAKINLVNKSNQKGLWEFLLKMLEDLMIKFSTVPLQDLEIIGMLETRNLNFNHVLILDMQEGIVPVERKVDPLIPISVLKDIGLPSPEFQEEIYEYYFYRLIKNAEKVSLFYIDTPRMDRSRYIERIIWDHEKENRKLDVKKVDKIQYKIKLTGPLKENEIVKDEYIKKKLSSLIFSPSGIDAFLFCQIKFYYSNVLNLSIPESIDIDIDNTERGKIIHDILKSLFNIFKGKFLSNKDYEEIKVQFDKIFNNEFMNITSGEFYVFKKMAFIKLNQYLNKFVKNIDHEFKVIEVEKSLKSSYKIDNININLKGRIDRVDIERNNDIEEYIIIDYKTGDSKKRFEFKEDLIDESDVEKIRVNIKTFQPFIYIYMFLNNMKNLSIEHIDAKLLYLGDLKESLLLKSNKKYDKNEIYEYYNHLLKNVLKEIIDPDKPFIKYNKVECEYCEFSGFCRFKKY